MANGARVQYRDEGGTDGTAVVLIHGAMASLHTWEPSRYSGSTISRHHFYLPARANRRLEAPTTLTRLPKPFMQWSTN